ncbi:MAG: DNA polymerase III subunit delta' [Bifidobacteriaceae bacterium]|jgi:DNA polymerase-3 subunit delta'|nr:DNA polymerase III subunit delta' [Bifidobacteriaceae bacterium]
MSVWEAVTGQAAVVEQLRQAASRPESMTHSWLITGPPGSGRSVAARAFAAALQCEQAGCGECQACRTVLSGSHPDVLDTATKKVVIAIDDVREWVTLSVRTPSQGRWRIIIVEDADRMLERTGNVLLKALEEPPPHTVWILSAPRPQDVLVTIRSRCRSVALRIPSVDAVAGLLTERDGADPALARLAALAAQCHIGVARRLVRDPAAIERRRQVLDIPKAASSVARAVVAAGQLDAVAKAEAETVVQEREAVGRTRLLEQLGEPGGSRKVSNYARARLREFDDESAKRARRSQADTLDRALIDLLAFYRDVFAVQCGARVDLINALDADLVAEQARTSVVAETVIRLDAIELARQRLAGNVAPALALEAMAVMLALPALAAQHMSK